jgi:hypothetical protein
VGVNADLSMRVVQWAAGLREEGGIDW